MRDTPRGLVIALPILMADGWQVVVHLEQEQPGFVTLSDQGSLVSELALCGVAREEGHRALLSSIMRNFGVKEKGGCFRKTLPLPLDAREIHLFGCFLSAASHLARPAPSP